eukprot:3889304-Rhodomonas_salina.1
MVRGTDIAYGARCRRTWPWSHPPDPPPDSLRPNYATCAYRAMRRAVLTKRMRVLGGRGARDIAAVVLTCFSSSSSLFLPPSPSLPPLSSSLSVPSSLPPSLSLAACVACWLWVSGAVWGGRGAGAVN